jgi:hypothetical protein
MKNEFVPYDIALAMKEMGFDEECFGRYVKEKLGWYALYTYDESDWVVNAPLYQQAFNYLIEKANSINNDDYSIKIDQLYYTLYNGKTHITTGSSPNKCLRKLIEIVKTAP